MPKGRTDADPVRTCASCGSTVMERGSDTVGWKGVQLTNHPTILSWYCPRPVCQQTLQIAFRTRVREMRVARGLSPDPPARKQAHDTRSKHRSPLAMGQDGVGHTFMPPPGGFAASEPAPLSETDEEG